MFCFNAWRRPGPCAAANSMLAAKGKWLMNPQIRVPCRPSSEMARGKQMPKIQHNLRKTGQSVRPSLAAPVTCVPQHRWSRARQQIFSLQLRTFLHFHALVFSHCGDQLHREKTARQPPSVRYVRISSQDIRPSAHCCVCSRLTATRYCIAFLYRTLSALSSLPGYKTQFERPIIWSRLRVSNLNVSA